MKLTNFNFDPLKTEFAPVRKFLALQSPEEKDVAYSAVAFALVDALIKAEIIDDESLPASIVMTSADAVNEIAIIDRPLFSSKMKSILEYRYDTKFSQPRPYAVWESLWDFLGITAYFSAADVVLINNNFGIFREAYSVTSTIFGKSLSGIED